MWKWQPTYDTFLNAVQDLTTDDYSLAQAAADTVRAAWTKEGKTKLSQHRELIKQFRKRLKDDLLADHIGLVVLNLSTEEWTESGRSTIQLTADHNQQQQILSPVTVNTLISRTTQCLAGQNWRNTAIALALLTGRRMTEVMKTAHFEKESEFSVWFTGAVKRGGEIDTLRYEIPTLCAADEAIQALRWLRQEMPTAHLTVPQCNKFSGELNQGCESLLTDLIPPPAGKERLNFHRVRGVYAAIATYFYCPLHVAEPEFRAHIMGHFQLDDGRPLRERRSLTSDRHYLSYAITDRDGAQHKGVRLDWHHVQVLKEFQPMPEVKEQTMIDAIPGTAPSKSRKRYTVGFWDRDRERLETILGAIAPENNPQFPTAKSDRLAILLDWVENKLEEPKQQIRTNSDISLGLEQQTKAIDLLNNTVERLTQQISQQKSHPELVEQVEQLELDNQQLRNERDHLQAKLDGVYQTLGITPPETTRTATNPASHHSLTPHDERTNHSADNASPNKQNSGTRHNHSLAPSATAESTVAQEKTSSDKLASYGLDPDIVRAVQTVMLFNDTIAQSHADKWAIAVNPLQQLLMTIGKGTNTKIMKTLKQLREQIDEHHQKHALGPRHNKCHKGQSITDVISI